MLLNELREEIKQLEERLLHTDYKKEPKLVDELLAENFIEISPKGQRINRDSVVAWLLQKEPDARWLMQEFSVQLLAENLLLATYQAKQIAPTSSSLKGSMRSSLWLKETEQWQMAFHQATKIL